MYGILERPPDQRPMGSIPDQETKLRNLELDCLHGRLQKDNSPHLQGAYGPVAEYDRRVKSGVLKDDQHQRTIIESLQDLHDMLANYNPPTVQEPSIESLQPKKQGFLSSIFGGGQKSLSNLDIPSDLPKGLYMYGDVGSGKTMM
ncbi:hypothetical protein KCU77_g14335, partial [Aureobasidium melanogenum]